MDIGLGDEQHRGHLSHLSDNFCNATSIGQCGRRAACMNIAAQSVQFQKRTRQGQRGRVGLGKHSMKSGYVSWCQPACAVVAGNVWL